MTAIAFAVLALACAVMAVGMANHDARRGIDPTAIDGWGALLPRAGALLGFPIFAVLAVGAAVW